MDTRRCIVCGCPCIDHVPLSYVLKALFWHRIMRRIK